MFQDTTLPVSLKVNCGYARTAIRELTPTKKGLHGRLVQNAKRSEDFRKLFDIPTYQLDLSLFECNSLHSSKFDRICDTILNTFSKKWHPPSARIEYQATFSTGKWNTLLDEDKSKHTLSSCKACYHEHQRLQEVFPGKPVFILPIVTLPKQHSASRKAEKQLAKKLLTEIDMQWEGRYEHSFTDTLPQNVPDTNLTKKKTKGERKKEERASKRKLVEHINQQQAKNTTMSVLAEAESLSSYNRKRLARSFETTESAPKRPKSHSPSQRNLTWDVHAAMEELENFPEDSIINWSAMARKYEIPQKNGGQILKEIAQKHNIDVAKLDRRQNTTPRVRRKKCRLPGGEVSGPTLPPKQVIVEDKKQLIASGELSIGEPCAPYKLMKSIVTSEGDIQMKSVEICGRKIPLVELRSRLLKKQEIYMHLSTNTDIQNMNNQQISTFFAHIHQNVPNDANLKQLQSEITTLQRNRTLAVWHDHSTILQTGYILFAIWVIYDPAVFFTENEYKAKTGKNITNLQGIIEEPAIYMIAPSSSSPTDQLALVGDRLECLEELSKPTVASNGVEIHDQLRFFYGDKPAQQFERGTQLGGTYKCGGCGVKDVMMQDLAHTLQHKWKSLADLQTLILAGKHGSVPGCLKPLEGLKVQELREELEARGQSTEGKLKPELQCELTSILEGAQRVPTLLTLNPTQSLTSLNLGNYEVLDCEPLHDIKGHLNNILPEITHLLPPPLKTQFQQILDTTLPKGKVSGAFLRVAAIKVLLKLRQHHADPLIVMLLETVVRMSEILYSQDSKRNPKMILRLYNCSWLHHELCCHLLSCPKLQSRSHLFGAYLHSLVVHAPPQYEIVCLRSTNAESQERLFSKAKHISLKATSRKPENVLPTILVSIQAQEKLGDGSQSIKKQDSLVSSAFSKMPPYEGTFIPRSFLTTRLPSWQAHLQRISIFLEQGEGIWWRQKEQGYQFLDSDSDPAFHTAGPLMLHFRNANLPMVYNRGAQAWKSILSSKTMLPTPSIRLYDDHGNYVGTRIYQKSPAESHQPTIEPAGSYQPTMGPAQFLQREMEAAESHQTTIALVGSHQPAIALAGSHQPTIELAGSHQQTTEPAESHQPAMEPAGSHQQTTEPAESYQPAMEPAGSYQPAMEPAGSYQPAMEPAGSYQPTMEPAGSYQPTMEPAGSYQPTMEPAGSYQPTMEPAGSYQPTMEPAGSYQPTMEPAGSHQQTTEPAESYQPAMEPAGSYQPAMEPAGSYQPTMKPAGSYQPTMEPAGSYQPTMEPAGSYQPTMEPAGSYQPTMEPAGSYQPTMEPAGSYQPTMEPAQLQPSDTTLAINTTEVHTNSPCCSTTPSRPASLVKRFLQTPRKNSQQLNQSTEDSVLLQCTLDHFHTENGLQAPYSSKAARLIYKAIGENSNLSKFDTLRAKLKAKKLNKQKPTPTERNEYAKLSAQLHTVLLSVKYTTRDAIKTLEKDYHQTHGTFPACTNTNPDYQQLRKKLDFAKKLCGLWDNYFSVI